MSATTQASTSGRYSHVRYADPEYWNDRYKNQPCEFDWFFGYTALRRVVRDHLKKNKLCLHVGCGNSNFQEGLVHDGYQVINTDISSVLIDQMKQKHQDEPGLSYMLSDCRDMPEFRDSQFGSVIDKGTVDALLCDKDGPENVMKMFAEISRVLCPGGIFMLITLGDPAYRLPLLCQAQFDWTVTVCMVPRVASDLMKADPTRAVPLNDTTKPLKYTGPLTVNLCSSTVEGLPGGYRASEYFYAYVCKRTPIQLSVDSTQKTRMPESWRAATKEVVKQLSKELGLSSDLTKRGRRVNQVSRSTFESFALAAGSGGSAVPAAAHEADAQDVAPADEAGVALDQGGLTEEVSNGGRPSARRAGLTHSMSAGLNLCDAMDGNFKCSLPDSGGTSHVLQPLSGTAA